VEIYDDKSCELVVQKQTKALTSPHVRGPFSVWHSTWYLFKRATAHLFNNFWDIEHVVHKRNSDDWMSYVEWDTYEVLVRTSASIVTKSKRHPSRDDIFPHVGSHGSRFSSANVIPRYATADDDSNRQGE